MRIHSKKLASSPVDLDDNIVADLRCIKCGVNLRGCSINDPCQQCGHPTSDSVYGDYLIYSDRSETHRLEDATRLIIYATIVTGLLFVIATPVLVATAPTLIDAIQRAYDMLFTGVLLFPVVAVTGIALLTRRHEAAYYEAKYFNERGMIRAGLIALTALTGLSLAAYYFPHTVQCCLLVAWATVPAAMFFGGLSQLMRRMPNIRLANFSRGICVGVYILGLLTLAFMLLRPRAMDNPNLQGALIALQFLTTWGWLCLGLTSLRLLVLVRRNFHVINR